MSKLRTDQLETLDGLHTKNVADLVDDINEAQVTTSTGEQTLVEALDSRLPKSYFVSAFDFMTQAQIASVTLGTLTEDVTDAIRAAWATGRNVWHPKGQYLITGELEVTHAGQVLTWENAGGYGYGEDIGLNWEANTRFVVRDNNFTRRVRTRRKWRGSASDPQDDPLSVVINVQAEGVVLDRPCVWLDCDYSDDSPTNLGDDVDVGIFVGTRVGVQMRDPQVIGYFRHSGIYFDVSNGRDFQQGIPYPRFPSLEGQPYPMGTVPNGMDGAHLFNPYIRGARQGLVILGGRPKPGESGYTDDYYDELYGGLLQDRRGSFGASDFAVFGGRIYGPDHHSNRRLKDPELDGGVISETSMLAEPDNAPCAVHLDGLAGNASSNIWGIRFYGTRIATFEAFRVRLNKASRVFFYSVHMEGRGGGRLDTEGNTVNSNDYEVASYGNVACTSNTDRISSIGTSQQTMAAYAPHNYGAPISLQTDSGRNYIGGRIESSRGELDIRGAADQGVRFRSGSETRLVMFPSGTLENRGHIINATGEQDIRGAEGHGVLFRSGSQTIGKIPPEGISNKTTGQTANVYVTGTHELQRSTSAAKYKTDIQPITDDALDRFLQLDGITYLSLCSADDPERRFSGVVADQAHELGLTDLVVYGDDGEVEGFAYERATAYLLEIVKRRLIS